MSCRSSFSFTTPAYARILNFPQGQFPQGQRLGDRVVSLGPLGAVRVIDAPIWWARGGFRPTPVMLWIAWLAGAGALVALATRLPGSEWCAALLLGGSLSHMIETSRRGRVCDYLCLRFWPAFNLADAAILIGTVGFIVQAICASVRLLQ